MLRLLHDGRQPSHCTIGVLPETIVLSDRLTAIGRSYKADVKLMLPFISRKHLTLTRIDGRHFLETPLESVVFVNDVRVSFKVLHDGCTITLGGVRKTFLEGMKKPSNLASHVVYQYSLVRDIVGGSGFYQEPNFRPNELMTLEDFVGGRIVKEIYHLEDFNSTLDEESFEASNSAAVGGAAGTSSVTDNAGTSTSSGTSDTGGTSTSSVLVSTASGSTTGAAALRTVISSTAAVSVAPLISSTDTATTALSSATAKSYPAAAAAAAASKPTPPPSASTASCRATSPTDSIVGSFAGIDGSSSSSHWSNYRSEMRDMTIVHPDNDMDVDMDDYGDSDSSTNYFSFMIKRGRKSSLPKPASATTTTMTHARKKSLEQKCASLSTRSSSLKIPVDAHFVSMKVWSPPTDISDAIGDDSQPAKSTLPLSTAAVVVGLSPFKRRRTNDAQTENDAAAAPETTLRPRRKCNGTVKYASSDDSSGDDNVIDEIMADVKNKHLFGRSSGKGKSKAKSSSDRSVTEWEVPLESQLQPKMVHIISSHNLKINFTEFTEFTDQEIFAVELADKGWSIKADVALLVQRLKTGQVPSDDLQLLMKLVKKCWLKTDNIDMKVFETARLPQASASFRQSSSVTLPLKPYQLSSVQWMMGIERHASTNWLHPRVSQFQTDDSQLLFDPMNGTILVPPVPASSEVANFKIHVKGGILADEMGLGKTITMIGLFVHNPATDIPQVPSYSSVLNGSLLECRTSLIVAPSHLTRQWQDEIQTHARNLRVLVITTKPQHERLTYLDILQADVVIISVQFILMNRHFMKMASSKAAKFELQTLARRPGQNLLMQHAPNLCHFLWHRVVCDEAHEIIMYESAQKPIYCEETQKDALHTVLVPCKGLLTVLGFQSRYRWYVTGTPFPHGINSLVGALRFLELNVVSEPRIMGPDGIVLITDEPEDRRSIRRAIEKRSKTRGFDPQTEMLIDPRLYRSHIIDFVHQRLFIRNTKDSVVDDYDVPQYIEELMLLPLSDVERGVYDNCVTDLEKRQLCCHLQVIERLQKVMGSDMLTLKQVKQTMIAHTNQEIERIKGEIGQFERDILAVNTEIRLETLNWKKTRLELRKERIKEDIEKLQAEVRQHSSAVAYFESLERNGEPASDVDNTCVICLDEITRLTLTPCGHMFCFECIRPCIVAKGSCPTCRKDVTVDQLVEVKDKLKSGSGEAADKTAELKHLTELYGTKMAYLIFFLRYLFIDNPKSRVIIFSQWEKMLHMIGQTLQENGIANVFIKGNVHVRTRAISIFKTKGARVIMLSLANAASGTNLTEATHIVLIDPIAGTEAEASAIERQAIGRAHRMGQTKQLTVVRMIMRDTIEQELYERNNKRDIAQVALTFTSNHGIEMVRRTVSNENNQNVANTGATTSTSSDLRDSCPIT